jgi:hypothetical protein
MMNRYSKSTGTFYPLDIDYGDSLPADAIEVSAADFDAAMGRPVGHTFDFVGGRLVISAPPPAPYEPQRDAYLLTVRTTREAILNRLTGIGLAALLANDTQVASAVSAARVQLLDITTDSRVIAATDIDGLKGAVLAAYHDIVQSVPASLKNAFNGVSQ